MLLILLLSLLHLSTSLSCSGPHGSVEWYAALKMPKVKEFLYSELGGRLVKCEPDLNDPLCAIGRTLSPIYSNSTKGLNYLMYNDEVPGGMKIFDRGHAKGVLMFDATSVVFLVHSTPHFPNNKSDGYEFPDSGTKYGQSFLCMTLGIDQLPSILTQLRVMWPFVYEHQLTSQARSKYPDLSKLVEGEILELDSSVKELVLARGTTVTAFAKDKAFNADIYMDLMAPYLSSTLITETWQNGVGRLSTNCSQVHSVYNMRRIELLGYEYKETLDHSKWAISDNKPLVCIGGVNRMRSQFLRGGGAFCLTQCEGLWSDMREGVVEVEQCPEQS